MYKGYHVTDGWCDIYVCAASRSKATGRVLAERGQRIDFRRLRTVRAPELDSPSPWYHDAGAFATVEYWGASVQLP